MRSEDGARSCGVLVVDDDEDIRDTLRDVLEDEGHAVATARDGHQAMQYLASNPSPVVMILDLMMPVKNGWQVLSELAAQPGLAERVRVVVVLSVTTKFEGVATTFLAGRAASLGGACLPFAPDTRVASRAALDRRDARRRGRRQSAAPPSSEPSGNLALDLGVRAGAKAFENSW